MFFMLIATFAAGIVAAGIALAAPRLVGKRAPRHLPPVAAGVAMFAFMLWNEYSWFDRSVEALPEGVEVAASYPYSNALQPWTLIAPRVNRFAAVDVGGARRNADLPDQVMADVLLFSRFEEAVMLPQVFDCAATRRADAAVGPSLEWVDVDPDDPLLNAACGG